MVKWSYNKHVILSHAEGVAKNLSFKKEILRSPFGLPQDDNMGGVMKVLVFLILAAMAFSLTSCAIIHPVKPQEAFEHPLGTDSLKIGMTKEQVRDLLGEPDVITPLDRSADMLSTERQEWVYHPRYSNLPVGADYFGKGLSLTFDGNNLTGFTSQK